MVEHLLSVCEVLSSIPRARGEKKHCNAQSLACTQNRFSVNTDRDFCPAGLNVDIFSFPVLRHYVHQLSPGLQSPHFACSLQFLPLRCLALPAPPCSHPLNESKPSNPSDPFLKAESSTKAFPSHPMSCALSSFHLVQWDKPKMIPFILTRTVPLVCVTLCLGSTIGSFNLKKQLFSEHPADQQQSSSGTHIQTLAGSKAGSTFYPEPHPHLCVPKCDIFLNHLLSWS